MRTFFLVVACAAVAAPAVAVEIGLSGPSVYGGNSDGAIAAAKAVEATGTSWVRLNFRLDVWSAPDDSTPRGPQQLSWFAAYDRLVDELTTHGVQVYGEIGGESVPGGGEPDSDDFVQRYTSAFVQIVDHFKDRVRVYETFNEPNNWRDAVSKRPAVSPFYLAKMEQEIYLATKFNNGRDKNRCDQVTLVSGALFSSEQTNAADYFNQVFDAGRNQLAWDWMHQHVGSYPFDGIGYHIYVGQGASATTTSVAAATKANLDAMWAAEAGRDDGAAAKRVWLSEFGWTVDQVSAQQQAQFLTAAFDSYAADAHVAAAFWFTYQDFPGGRYGLYDAGGLDAAHRRADYDAFTAAVASHRPALAAVVVADDVPMTLAPGETRIITLTLRNTGGESWSEATQHRLGAAPGCPAAAVTNAVTFAPDKPGYVNGVADARVTLTATVAPGADGSFRFAVTAPATAGDYVLGARMVQEGVAWFGDTFRRTLHVAAASGGGGGGGAGGGGGSGGGTPGDGAGGSTGGTGPRDSGAPGVGKSHGGCAIARGDDTPGAAAPVLLFVSLLAIFLRSKKTRALTVGYMRSSGRCDGAPRPRGKRLHRLR